MADEAASAEPSTGRFLPGNKFWLARSSAGPKPIFANSEQLWKACCEYFEWVEANPLYEDRIVSFQGAVIHVPAAKMRAMTIGGLCLFLGVARSTWNEWRSTRSDLSEVITHVDEAIYTQKFTGAAADLLNANIISRELGLADKQEHMGKDGKDLIPEKCDDLELARFFAGVLTNAANKQDPQ